MILAALLIIGKIYQDLQYFMQIKEFYNKYNKIIINL